MRLLRGGLLVIFYLLATALSLIVAFSPIAWSWWMALQRDYVTEGRMQWCIIVKTPIVKGLKLTDENVEWTIRRVPTGDHFIPDARRVVGKYAVVNLAEGQLLKPEHFSAFAPSEALDGGVTIPVEVKTEHAGGLKPGMRLAFVQEEEKESTMIPEARELTDQTTQTGFVLLSVTVSQKDLSITALTIAVAKSDLDQVPKLASGQWRPVILNAPR